MKPVRIALALAALAIVPIQFSPARADCRSSCPMFNGWCNDGTARIASRQSPRNAEFVIDNRGGEVTLLLTRDVVALQLSDRTLRKIRREMRDNEEDEDNALGQAIRTAVYSIVQTALHHSVEYPIRDIREASYDKGQLILVTEDGERLFSKVKVNDVDVFRDFSADDARDFVREFRRIKSGRGGGRASL